MLSQKSKLKSSFAADPAAADSSRAKHFGTGDLQRRGAGCSPKAQKPKTAPQSHKDCTRRKRKHQTESASLCIPKRFESEPSPSTPLL